MRALLEAFARRQDDPKAAARRRFAALSKQEREDLLAFLRSL